MNPRRVFSAWFAAIRRLVGPADGDAHRLPLTSDNTWLIAAGVILLLGCIIAAALYVEVQPTTLRIAVGPTAGDDARLIEAMATQFARDRATIRLRGGSAGRNGGTGDSAWAQTCGCEINQ